MRRKGVKGNGGHNRKLGRRKIYEKGKEPWTILGISASLWYWRVRKECDRLGCPREEAERIVLGRAEVEVIEERPTKQDEVAFRETSESLPWRSRQGRDDVTEGEIAVHLRENAKEFFSVDAKLPRVKAVLDGLARVLYLQHQCNCAIREWNPNSKDSPMVGKANAFTLGLSVDKQAVMLFRDLKSMSEIRPVAATPDVEPAPVEPPKADNVLKFQGSFAVRK